jgi:hypothetical protein
VKYRAAEAFSFVRCTVGGCVGDACGAVARRRLQRLGRGMDTGLTVRGVRMYMNVWEKRDGWGKMSRPLPRASFAKSEISRSASGGWQKPDESDATSVGQRSRFDRTGALGLPGKSGSVVLWFCVHLSTSLVKVSVLRLVGRAGC